VTSASAPTEPAAPLPTLPGRLCSLRALVLADAPSLQRHADDPAVAHNLFDGFPQPYSLQEAEHWCAHFHREPQFGHVWGIAVAGEVAGCISVAPERGLWSGSACIGYWLGQAHWRRGIVSEALALVTQWAWAQLPQVMRLYMPIYARNTGSRGVARRAGYVQEGYLPYAVCKAGQSIDAVLYGAYRPGLPAPTP
jgi:ribosomal-protein-alanine N-acetyltransferase